jgi:hypothetical protein
LGTTDKRRRHPADRDVRGIVFMRRRARYLMYKHK